MRRLLTAAAALAFFVTSPGYPPPGATQLAALPAVQPSNESDCSNVVFMTDGYRAATTGASFAAVPARAGWHTELIRYDDSIIGVIQPHTLDWTVDHAVPVVVQRVRSFHAACPQAHITLLGYSFGALIAGDAAEELAHSDDVPHRRLNVVLFGDPRRPLSRKGIEGWAGGYLTVMASTPGITASAPRDFGDLQVSENCNQNDVICNAANPLTNPAAFRAEVDGYLHGAHYYPMDPWRDAAAGDHYVAATSPLSYGAPIADLPTPRELTQPAGIDVAGILEWPLSYVVNRLDWSEGLNRFGLPGDALIHEFIGWSERAGVQL
ncbi:cutinase family protein [Branchiibius sp. NY16-3462-2]|uniref:cutinase family protein n=1 Tax=Branchiibius sp. NY16-3462-2 TaxID=1807500 RepID=UPI000797126B|nr:cutinase family protein [Branchiibius sp. NY16-3462-2]KYH45221.1 hypothetical protein AZH51_15245 [Branchiibius sp. NY16-3462-2]